jgi:hypothetical protein
MISDLFGTALSLLQKPLDTPRFTDVNHILRFAIPTQLGGHKSVLQAMAKFNRLFNSAPNSADAELIALSIHFPDSAGTPLHGTIALSKEKFTANDLKRRITQVATAPGLRHDIITFMRTHTTNSPEEAKWVFEAVAALRNRMKGKQPNNLAGIQATFQGLNHYVFILGDQPLSVGEGAIRKTTITASFDSSNKLTALSLADDSGKALTLGPRNTNSDKNPDSLRANAAGAATGQSITGNNPASPSGSVAMSTSHHHDSNNEPEPFRLTIAQWNQYVEAAGKIAFKSNAIKAIEAMKSGGIDLAHLRYGEPSLLNMSRRAAEVLVKTLDDQLIVTKMSDEQLYNVVFDHRSPRTGRLHIDPEILLLLSPQAIHNVVLDVLHPGRAESDLTKRQKVNLSNTYTALANLLTSMHDVLVEFSSEATPTHGAGFAMSMPSAKIGSIEGKLDWEPTNPWHQNLLSRYIQKPELRISSVIHMKRLTRIMEFVMDPWENSPLRQPKVNREKIEEWLTAFGFRVSEEMRIFLREIDERGTWDQFLEGSSSDPASPDTGGVSPQPQTQPSGSSLRRVRSDEDTGLSTALPMAGPSHIDAGGQPSSKKVRRV